MESVARLPPTDRRDLFAETAARKGMTPAIVEKDFWVCWTLGRLFTHPELSRLLMFKGGTSLSKVFNLIERFSEDIDLILDWRVVTDVDDPLTVRSKSGQEKLNATIDARALQYIAGDLLEMVAGAVEPVCRCELSDSDPHAINIVYPAAFSDAYLRPAVLLEIGPLAAWLPSDTFQIRPYAAEAFPQLFKQATSAVQAIRAERTFWEKATILHYEANRPEGSSQPTRYSRHYYDLAMMAVAPVKDVALADLALLEDVANFKQRFYPRGWARYDQAVPGTFRLVPSGYVLPALAKDYAQMRNMIFGRYPNFEEMMEMLRKLETEINKPHRR
ncbi:MAG: hypothetical protein RLZZ144_979 [Pseudomonadota bacterium]|jgi:hypothetical protein